MVPEDIKLFIEQIKKDKSIDVTKNISVITESCIALQNNEYFDFSCILIVDGCKSGICMNGYVPFGTSEDNNIYIETKYYEILKKYYCTYLESKDSFIVRLYDRKEL